MADQSDKEIIAQFFKQLRDDVITSQSSKGIRASGASAEALRVETPEDQIGQLIDGAGYFEQQEYGRGPSKGSAAGAKTLQQAIYDWLEFKKYGFNYENDTRRKSLSWAIATKIHREGTFVFRNSTQTGVLSEVLTPQRLSSISSVFARKYASEIKTDVTRIFNA